MKKAFLSIVLITIASCSFAQWTTSGSNIYYNSGNVGIGTTSPGSDLNVFEITDSKPGGIVAPTKSVLKLSRNGTLNYSYSESAEFRIGHGGPSYWGSQLDLFLNGASNTSNSPDQQVMTWLYNGNVGIGTTTPGTALQIGNFNSGSSNNQLLIPGVYNFEQIKLGQIGNGDAALEFVNHNSSTNSYGVKLLVDVDQVPGMQFQYATSTTSYASLSYVTGLYMNLSGNVGIGTINPGSYRLAVNGGIHSQSVNVDLTGWSDYVFKKEYTLPSLADVKTYIDQNHHLPDMPSEQEVIKEGINLGEMNKLLTKKVEELTLYLIEKDKQLSVEQKKNQQQDSRIAALEAALSKLTSTETHN